MTSDKHVFGVGLKQIVTETNVSPKVDGLTFKAILVSNTTFLEQHSYSKVADYDGYMKHSG